MRSVAYLLLMIALIAMGCDRDSNNDLRSTQNAQHSPDVVIKTASMGFGHISEGPEDLYGPFTFETEGTFVGVPSWTFSGELLDARLQPVPGVGNTIGILVGAPSTVGTFFITATVLDTGNGATHTVTVPFTVVDCTPGVLGTNILDISATVSGTPTEGVPFQIPISVMGTLSPLVTWRAISPNPNINFGFVDANTSTTLVMEGHTAADLPVSVVVTAIDNGPDIDSLDSDGFFEQIIGSGSGCSVSLTLTPGGTGGGGGGGGGVEDCTNGIDDDGDGLVDGADPDCATGGGCEIASTDTPLAIPDADATGVTSTITPGCGLTITDVRVGIDATHTFIGDLTLTLTSPASTVVVLSTGNGGAADDMEVIFDDAAGASITTFAGGGAFGSFSPEGSLASLIGESTDGTWTLTVIDGATLDTGTLDAWALAFNGSGFSAPFE